MPQASTTRCAASATIWCRPPPFDSNLGHEHAIELVAGGPAEPGGSLAAATDPRSEGLPAVW